MCCIDKHKTHNGLGSCTFLHCGCMCPSQKGLANRYAGLPTLARGHEAFLAMVQGNLSFLDTSRSYSAHHL